MSAAFALFAIASLARAEDAAPAPAPTELRANVASIEDNRSTAGYNSVCRLTLTFVGDEVADTRGVLDVHVTKALDELDRDLIAQGTALTHLRASGMMMAGRIRAGSSQAEGVITLRNPSRRAATIKVIEGAADLFRPTEANDGMVVIPDGLAHRDVAIESVTLQKYGIELTCLSEQKAATVRPFFPSVTGTVIGNPTPEEEQRRLEAVAAEVARRRALREAGARQSELLSSGPEPTSAATHAPAPVVKSGGTLPPSEAKAVTTESSSSRVGTRAPLSNEVAFQIKDPQHKVIELECRGADGRVLSRGPFVGTGTWAVMRFESAPPTDAKLVVYLAAPGAIESHPFKVENIALP